jgi:hypothetical protein
MRLLPQIFGVEAQIRIGMKRLGYREPAFNEGAELRQVISSDGAG